MENKESIDFIVRGRIKDTEITPTSVPLFLLDVFTDDVASILTSTKQEKKEDIFVSIEDGSFLIKALVILATHGAISGELQEVRETNSLESVNIQRSNILRKWVKLAKKYPGVEFEIKTSEEHHLILNETTEFTITEDFWIPGDFTVYGEITDWGGNSTPNIHLKTEGGKMLTIDCKKEDLEKESDNRLYRQSAIKIVAEQNLNTGELRNPKFIEFVDYNPVFDQNQLLTLAQKGREAWNDVPDHLSWLRNMRDNNE